MGAVYFVMVGIIWIIFVSLSVNTTIAVFPSFVSGNWVIRSIVTEVQGACAIGKGWYNPVIF